MNIKMMVAIVIWIFFAITGTAAGDETNFTIRADKNAFGEPKTIYRGRAALAIEVACVDRAFRSVVEITYDDRYAGRKTVTEEVSWFALVVLTKDDGEVTIRAKGTGASGLLRVNVLTSGKKEIVRRDDNDSDVTEPPPRKLPRIGPEVRPPC